MTRALYLALSFQAKKQRFIDHRLSIRKKSAALIKNILFPLTNLNSSKYSQKDLIVGQRY